MAITSVQLRALNAVLEEGGYSAAARRLGLSQPAISQAIKKLQQTYDIRLFEQRGKNLIPTELCLELTEVTAQFEALEAEIKKILQRGETLEAGTLKIGLGNAMPGLALIGEFKKGFPTVRVNIRMGDFDQILSHVLERRVDVGILPNIPTDGRFYRLPCIPQQIVGIVSQNHPLAVQTGVRMADLLKYPLIFRPKKSATQKVVNQALDKLGLNVEPGFTVDSRDGVCEAVANGLGVGFIWNHGTSRKNGIVKIPIRELNKTYEEAIFRRTDTKSKIVDTFFHSAGNSKLFRAS